MAKGEKRKKVKSGFFRVIFSRTGLVFVLILLQLALLLFGYYYLTIYKGVFYGIMITVSVLLVVYIHNSDSDPSFKMAWLIPILLAPAFGAFFYLFIHLQVGTKVIARRLQKNYFDTSAFLEQDELVKKELEIENPRVAGLAHYVKNYGGYPIYNGTGAKYYPFGEDVFEDLKKDLRKAKKFIFLEFFIIERGVMFDSILNILREKVREGVEVRLMYDGTCSIMLVPYNFPSQVEKMGIKCKVFSQVRPFLSTSQNNRDHRKIVVIDGHTGYTGGFNLADEYINVKYRFGVWKDTGVKINGPAVKNMTMMFLQMWNVTGNEKENYQEYILPDNHAYEFGYDRKGYVMPYGDSPLDKENIGKQVYIDIMNNSKKYVHIVTPYLILDSDTVCTLKYVAKRGVSVKIITPHIPDKKYVYYLAHSHYKDLISNGIEIYEYTPGFVHAKMFVSDDMKAVVGTINLDFRSLYLHWEDAVYFYGNSVVHSVENDFMETLSKCQKISLEDCKKFSLFDKVAGKVLRLIAPLM